MPIPAFTRICIGELDNHADANMNTFFTVGDVNGDGRLDIVSSGRSGQMAWFENRPDGTWRKHAVADVQNQECGGLVWDVNGDGLPDIVNGGDWKSDRLSWWQNPGETGGAWTQRVIAATGQTQFHDEVIGDVTGDGAASVVFTNQGGGALYRVPVPADPTVTPWPGIETIATEMREGRQPEEGLALVDLDGDGVTEIIFGQCWYKYRGAEQGWEQNRYAQGYMTTVIAVGDINGDGKPEIVLSEGDACIYGRPEGGKLAWFAPGSDIRQLWTEHVLETNLLDPHSLQLGDICGNGHLDLLVGEIGRRETLETNPPRLMVYENDGAGRFTRHVIDEGTGTHHARLADFGRGVLDIVSRPLHGPEKWKIFCWQQNRPAASSSRETGPSGGE